MAVRKRSRKLLYTIIILVILALVAGGVALMILKPWEKKESSPMKETTSSKTEEKPEMGKGEASSEEEKVPEKEEVKQYEGSNPNTLEELTGAVTYTGFSGDYLLIRVNIDQYLASGTCKLTLTRNGATAYEETAGIIDSAATSTCEGFNVPLSKLAGPHYDIVVELSSGGKTGKITGEVTL